MWKIAKLRLKNFSLIRSGLDRDEITLDFTKDDNTFFLFIGKMGSGKTAILGHLQPFATYGTLDARNQDNQIIEGENGEKEIIILHGEDCFHIVHNYNWNKHSNSHNTKSYISLNGVELNPNGNNSSFKEIVKLHFGIDQSHLRLLRLGTNVSNLIELKSTERKAYMASRLSDAEIYTLIYKKLSDILRQENSKISMLSNKLVSLSADNIDAMEDECKELGEDIKEYEEKIRELRAKIVEHNTTISFLLKDKSIAEYKEEIKALNIVIDDTNNEIASLVKSIDDSSSISLEEISNTLATYNYRKNQIDERIMELTPELNKLDNECNKLRDMLAISASEDHMNTLKELRDNLQAKVDRYTKALKGFKCDYSYRNITKIIEDISVFKFSLEELSQYNNEDLKLIYNSDNSLGTFCNKKINTLTGAKVNLQKRLNNLRFSESYIAQVNMFRPPMCPTKTCPYFSTHPVRLKKDIKENKHEIDNITNKISAIDVEIDRYSILPIAQRKMQTLKSMWTEISSTLQTIGVLNEDNLFKVLSNLNVRMNWYNHNDLINISEKCKMLEEFYDLNQDLNKTKSEIASLESSDNENINNQIKANRDKYNKAYSELENITKERVFLKDKIESYEALYADAQNIEQNKKKLSELSSILEGYEKEKVQMNENVNIAYKSLTEIDYLKNDINELSNKVSIAKNKYDGLSSTINDIIYTRKEFDETIEGRDYLKDIVSATSSKDGIPLIMIQLFLDNCRDIVNELIADVFQDALEIVDFSLTENEFKIPYSINGKIVDDISSASQGQKAIINIALSFALITQLQISEPTDMYNIMLLDEMDGALYKKDRDKFASILFKQLKAINALQVFLITHNHASFDGNRLSVIMTTEEVFDASPQHIYRLY